MSTETIEILAVCIAFIVFITYDTPDHFLVYLMKLELLVIMMLIGLEDSFGLFFFFILMAVVSSVLGLSVLVSMSRTSGADRASLGMLVGSGKWDCSLKEDSKFLKR